MKIKDLNKSNFMKNTSLLFIVFCLITSFAINHTTSQKSENYQMMLYGIAYNKSCGSSESYVGYRYKLIYVNDYNKNSRKEFENYLKETIPDATRYHISTSKFDFGPEASHMCVIKWANNINKCKQEVIQIIFDKSEEACYNRAVKSKNTWAFEGKKADFNILERKAW